ncbi:MAG: CopG family transcriptional regulator [Candidatus Korarchaeota archaeon]|nr:CopG family transcriptional regulator [Candidatus Korarchaeota archaeon]
MSEVVSFKVRRDLKRKMEAFKDRVNWSEELRKFVELKIRELEAKESKERIREKLRNAPWSLQKGSSTKLVREDRDSH